MRIFITGGSGLLGSKIAELALKKGYDVYSGYHSHRPSLGEPVKIDLANSESIIKAIRSTKPEVIIHTAGSPTWIDMKEKES